MWFFFATVAAALDFKAFVESLYPQIELVLSPKSSKLPATKKFAFNVRKEKAVSIVSCCLWIYNSLLFYHLVSTLNC